jgi:hypothetical protein
MGNTLPKLTTKNYSINTVLPVCAQNKNEIQKQVPLNIKRIKHSDLLKAFKFFSNNTNSLTIDKFNECIAGLLKFNIPLFNNSYLSERLFNLIDKVFI